MKTWLLTWNPSYASVHEIVAVVAERGSCPSDWSTRSRQPRAGDRAVLMRQGVAPRGIVAVATVTGRPYRWSDGRWYVPLIWEIFEPGAPLIGLGELRERWPSQCWSPRGSGIRVQPPVDAMLLEALELQN